jgi:hypothetical protein
MKLPDLTVLEWSVIINSIIFLGILALLYL